MIHVENARTTESPNAVLNSLATPSLGSAELTVWRVSMRPGAEGPVHVIDREQVWTTLAGSVEITADGSTKLVQSGQSAILPAGEVRQVRVVDGPVDALVCMSVGGCATAPGSDERHPLPWAQ
ncbi:cupin domain-containing protein [Kibdelosporangium philippinense]|uniref:Cupin domain-containing protein n=1 Tax=Kibdelosporangium philippinense TaxID=211113 RepID=A0ABS8ZYX6_9PSEU|nr:cupin domain-containing protein [Kibdelosporangium philippinense]MCE7011412.1 cupin domain-containing protein [Kibdelosporangium philippinense]